jgi:Animal haem peroxidase
VTRPTTGGWFVLAGALLAAGAATLAKKRGGGEGYRTSLPWRIYNGASSFLDRNRGWDELPTPLGLAALVGVRNVLRQRNLHDTNAAPTVDARPVPPFEARFQTSRSADGSHNDLADPAMGRAGSRFGRNVPIEGTFPEPEERLLEPSPRVVSRELLTRDPFQPALSVNALVAPWLQFMIRDWFSHGRGDAGNTWTIRLADDDPWPEKPMQIPRTPADRTRPPDSDEFAPTYINTESHWWDASQLYGTSIELQSFLRANEDGKLNIREDGLLPIPTDPELDPTQVPGWWLGLALMQTIFIREHNAICDRLRAAYPSWSDDDLFERARLINAALIAKIHTVEWTPAVISHPTTKVALRANWWGLAGEKLHDLFGRVSGDEVLSGIPGSQTNHYGVPYSLTEEFVAVYRMHPLVPDDYSFRAAADDSRIREATFREIAGPHTTKVMDDIPMTDLLYSFGTLHPGVVVLHNFPRFLQEFERPDGRFQDLGATDILRSRELGVPRYNDFRRLLHLKPAESFEELTGNPEWAEQIRRVYDDEIERVDVTVGMCAERLPAGFAFSDTAFRIFVLMASRRLNSDRFFTVDYTPQVYTEAGMDWIDANDMRTVLLRHYPDLRPAMRGLDNAFAPWHRAGSWTSG